MINRIQNILANTAVWLMELPLLVGQLLFWITTALIMGMFACIGWCVALCFRILWFVWPMVLFPVVDVLRKVSPDGLIISLRREIANMFHRATYGMVPWSHGAARYLIQHPLIEAYAVLTVSYVVFLAFSRVFDRPETGLDDDIEDSHMLFDERQAPYRVWLPKKREKEKKR